LNSATFSEDLLAIITLCSVLHFGDEKRTYTTAVQI